MMMNMLPILQSIVCQLIENTIDQQLWDETIDRPNCGTSSYTLIIIRTENHLFCCSKTHETNYINMLCQWAGQLKIEID